MTRSFLALILALALVLPMATAMSSRQALAQEEPQIRISALNENGDPLPGGCFTLTPASSVGAIAGLPHVCDGEDGAEDGAVIIPSLILNAPMRAVMGRAPDGYQVSATEAFTHDPNETLVLDISLTSEPGGDQVTFFVKDPDGEPVKGACVSLFAFGEGGATGDLISLGCGRPDSTRGAVRLTGLPEGEYQVLFNSLPEGYVTATDSYDIVVITAGATPEAELAVAPGGELFAGIVDQAGEPIDEDAIHCFSYWPEDSEELARSTCAGRDFPAFVPVGSYVGELEAAPPGYQSDGPVEYVVEQGDASTVEFVVSEGGQGLTILSVSTEGEPVLDACYSSFAGAYACDSSDGEIDGATTLWGLETGSQLIYPTLPVSGFATPGQQSIEVVENQATEVTFEYAPGATVVVKLVDDSGNAVPDSCYGAALVPQPGVVNLLPAYGCDSDDGASDGSIVVPAVPADQSVVIYPASLPEGNRLPGSQDVEVAAGETAVIDSETGDGGVAFTIQEAGEIDSEATVCYAVFRAEDGEPGRFVTYGCDAANPDQPRSGSTDFPGIRPGDYLITQTNETGEPTGDPVAVTVSDEEAPVFEWPES